MKRKIFGFFLPALCFLLLAGCGDKDSGTIVSGRYYYPKDEEASADGGEEAASADGAGNPASAGGGERSASDGGGTGSLASSDGGEAGSGSADDATDTEEAAAEDAISPELFMITGNDMQSECLTLEQLASGKQYRYNYSLSTKFLDKYGNRTAVSNFDPGRVIVVLEKDEKGRAVQVQLSDAVWEYPDVTNFSIDGERGIFSIADSNYSYDDTVFVHSDGTPQKLSDLSDLDTLRVVGIGKKILSISVTSGHGELTLTNTELFDGSYVQVGSKIFSEITGTMTMEIPEGTYLVTVANNGYGGSTEVEVERGEETVLDLDTLKGEGPKFGNILFAVDVADAILIIDGEAVDYSEPIPLQYGIHSLTVTASSYETYSKKLFVNSEEATVVIGLSGEDASTSAEASAEEETGSEESSTSEDGTKAGTAGGLAGSAAGSLAGSYTGSSGSGSGSTGSSEGTSGDALSEAEIDVIVDELLGEDDDEESSSTVSDFLSTLNELLD